MRAGHLDLMPVDVRRNVDADWMGAGDSIGVPGHRRMVEFWRQTGNKASEATQRFTTEQRRSVMEAAIFIVAFAMLFLGSCGLLLGGIAAMKMARLAARRVQGGK